MTVQPFLLAWQNYFALLATASATLAGLLFVGLTFSVGAIKSDVEKIIRMWGEPPLYDFIQILVIGCLVQVPGLSPVALAVFLMLWCVWRSWRLAEIIFYFLGMGEANDLELADWMERAIVPGLLYLALFAASVGLLIGAAWATLVLALDSLGVLILGIYSTWTQLVWMAAQKNQPMN